MEDFAYIKKYRPIFNFFLEFIFNTAFSFALFFVQLVVFGLDYEGDEVLTFDLVLSLIFTGITFLLLLSYEIPELIKKLKFNKNNPNICAIKLDTINRKLYLTNKETEIFLKDIVDFDYMKVRESEFLGEYSSLTNEKVIKKAMNKSKVGNLKLKLNNNKLIIIERIVNIENVNKQLDMILKTK